MPTFRPGVLAELARNIQGFIGSKDTMQGTKRESEQQEAQAAGARRADSARTESGGEVGFVIIGAQKCGTTFLYHLLGQHPRVEPAAKKEIHYFDHHFGKGIGWYLSHFPESRVMEGQKTITGESSPYYMFHPRAPERIAQVILRARLIALLRNPVDRAYSHYQQEARRGYEPLTFEGAIEAEAGRLHGERDRILENESYTSFNHQNFSYLSRGIYVDQLQEWLRLFPREQMLVLKSEDLYGRTPEVLGAVFEFLDLPYRQPETVEPCLQGRYPPMDPATRQRLEDFFQPHNRRLYEFLSIDFGW